MNIKSL